MLDDDLANQIQEKVTAIETNRVLLGFMDQLPAVERLMVGESLRNPIDPTLDQEEVNQIRQDQREEFVEIWEEATTQRTDPPSYVAGNVEIEELPETEEIGEYLDEFRSQEHFQNLTSNVDDGRWGIGLVPLEQIVAIQPGVTTSAYTDIPTSEDGWLDVMKYSLPIRGNKYIMTQEIQSGAFTGVQLVSRGPNINLAGANVSRDDETDTFSINFEIKPNINVIQVVHYQDRYILRNGYHRCFQLLNSGETHVPAYIEMVDSFDQTGGANEGMFGQSTVMASRPPLLSDFLTDAAVDIDSAGMNKVIRIIAETTQIRR